MSLEQHLPTLYPWVVCMCRMSINLFFGVCAFWWMCLFLFLYLYLCLRLCVVPLFRSVCAIVCAVGSRLPCDRANDCCSGSVEEQNINKCAIVLGEDAKCADPSKFHCSYDHASEFQELGTYPRPWSAEMPLCQAPEQCCPSGTPLIAKLPGWFTYSP